MTIYIYMFILVRKYWNKWKVEIEVAYICVIKKKKGWNYEKKGKTGDS